MAGVRRIGGLVVQWVLLLGQIALVGLRSIVDWTNWSMGKFAVSR